MTFGMLANVILLFLIHQLNVLGGAQVSVSFNQPVLLDESTLHWTSSGSLQCTVTTIQPSTTTTPAITGDSVIVVSCADGSYGADCNTTSDICAYANPCRNNATCYSSSNLTATYACQCASGFTGVHCEIDQTACTEDTCWNDGTCTETSSTTFVCQCAAGFEGVNCETQINMCANVTCQNNGVCVSSYPTWSCTCLDSTSYTGTYCQNKNSALTVKEALSKSFAIAASLAIGSVFVFVIALDVLKYAFNVDPADRELYKMRLEQEKNAQLKFAKRPDKTTVAPYLIS